MRNNLSDGSFKANILIERQLLLIYCMNNNDSQSFYSVVISLFIKPELRKMEYMLSFQFLQIKGYEAAFPLNPEENSNMIFYYFSCHIQYNVCTE